MINFALKYRQSFMNEVKQKIMELPPDTIIFVSDYSDMMNDKAISRILSTMEKRGEIVRLGQGIYLKPEMSRFGVVYPSVHKIAEAIAQRDSAQILPAGETAENLLGLSTQVPMTYSYITSGSAREISAGGKSIVFKRGVPKNFAFENKAMALLFQALKSIGKGNVDDEALATIRTLLNTLPDKESARRDSRLLPAWMRQIIIPIII